MVEYLEGCDSINCLCGLNLCFHLPIMINMNLIDCEGFRLWCILYFLWNMKFCKNRKWSTLAAFAHNFPTLYKTLISFGFTPSELPEGWAYMREASIMTSCVQYCDEGNGVAEEPT
jgi:hypothetical protein